MDWKLIDKALKFASIAHIKDKRKGTDIPYISHPVAVAMMLLEAGYNTEVVIAGLLHDSLEDTPVTVEQIEETFGKYVRSIVEGCSELDKSLSWEERKRHTIEYLESAPNEIRWVTCADKLHNARSMYEDYQAQGESLWSRFKRGREQQEWYYTSIIESLSQGEPFGLLEELRNEVELLYRSARETTNVPSWFDSFVSSAPLLVSQFDFRDKLVGFLRSLGFQISVDREIGNNKIDIWATNGLEQLAIEVRYKTANLNVNLDGQFIQLKNQAAQDVSRYDFIKDVEKLEQVVHQRPDTKGYAFLITNDHLYWNTPKKYDSIDKAFHLYEDRVLSGLCNWNSQASTGTMQNRENGIQINGTYLLKWRPYLTFGQAKNETFKWLGIEIKK